LSRATEQQIARIEELLHNKILSCNLRSGMTYFRLDKLKPLFRQLLVERHLIGKDHAEAPWVRGVAFCHDERLSLMVNEEDHLRMQVICGGYRLEKTWQEVNAVDDALAEVVPFTFSARYGYLTACPSNVGTGMRASAMLHLPAIAMARDMEKVLALAQGRGLTVRGLYGEGTHASGDLYQISNQVSLGVSEQDILERVCSVVLQVMSFEREERERFYDQHRPELKTRVDRALSLLVSASAISSEEALHLLSQVRMGVQMDLTDQVPLEALNRLLLLTLPAHLQTIEGGKVDATRRNTLRAERIREGIELN
jgi:protein arginine kinase